MGYETSIYRSTPLILWVSLISSVISGIILVVLAIAKQELDRSYFWKIGFLLVLLSYVICLGLFIIRGYYMWCVIGDPGSHIGWIQETTNAGYTSTKLIYPITHIYFSEIIFLTDLDLISLHKLVPLIFGLLYVLFMYAFAKALFSESAKVLLTVLISCSLWLGWYLALFPNGLANLFLPVALFLMVRYLQQKTWPWATAFAAVILLYPAFHPVPTIFLGITFLTLWIPTILPDLINVLRKRKVGVLGFNKLNFGLMLPFLLLLIWFIFWISSFPMWDGTIRSMYLTICSEAESSQAMAFMDQAIYAEEHGFSIIEQAIRRFWGLIILSTLSLAALPLLWRSFSHGRHDEHLFSLYGPLGVLGLVIPALFIFNLAFGPLRLTVYILILGTVLAAYFLSYLLTDKSKEIRLHRPRLKTVFVILLIFSLFITGLLNLYPSPYNLTQSFQTTRSEMAGMECFFEHRDATTPISGILVAPRRFADLLLTPEEIVAQSLLWDFRDIDCPPWHFGYDIHTSISSVYDEETDLIITQLAKKNYEDYFPHLAPYRFNAQDFKRLNDDPGLNFLYTNGEFDVWKVTVSADP
ncbi:hypothetical protein DSECCO2_430820 [anaerobic digester metagenome]